VTLADGVAVLLALAQPAQNHKTEPRQAKCEDLSKDNSGDFGWGHVHHNDVGCVNHETTFERNVTFRMFHSFPGVAHFPNPKPCRILAIEQCMDVRVAGNPKPETLTIVNACVV